MSQITWTYVDDDGFPHQVGLFHGDNSGHLLVYCNTRIVVIDFSVLTSKNYSFFINEELCDLAIEEKEGKFSYGFSIDQITDTPRNRGRRKLKRFETRQTLMMGVAFIIMVTMMVFLFMHI